MQTIYIEKLISFTINVWCNFNYAILFTILGAYVTGWPLVSTRWYLAYLFGLVLVWTLPINKRSQFWGYALLAIGVLAKAYVGYLTPVIEVQTIPIAIYNGELVQAHPSFSKALTNLVQTNFAKDIDISLKNPKANKPSLVSISSNTNEPILYDFKIGSNFVDRSKTWILPVDVQQSFTTVPVVIAIQVKQADHGTIWTSDWQKGIFFEQKSDQTVLSHKGCKNGIVLKDHVGSTFFFPLIDSPNSSLIYIELCQWAIYLPLLLLVAAILLVNFTLFSARTLEQLICLSFAFITICTSDVHPNWPSCGFPYDSLHSLSNWVHVGVWDINAGQAPLWYLVNKLFYSISHFGYLLPMLCFWASAWALLQLLREFFKSSQSYIIWGILLTTPWLAKQGIGLHVYKPLHIIYSSIMLGLPLFLIGLLGYFRDFKPWHGLSWVAASLCNPVIAAGVSGLLLHKHLGSQRFIYLVVSLSLWILNDFNHLLSSDMLLSNPVTAWLLTKNSIHFEAMVSFIRTAYQPFFIIFGLIPNIWMAFSKNIPWRRFARAGLIMHGGFILSANIPQEAYLACSLSAICTFIYLSVYISDFKKR